MLSLFLFSIIAALATLGLAAPSPVSPLSSLMQRAPPTGTSCDCDEQVTGSPFSIGYAADNTLRWGLHNAPCRKDTSVGLVTAGDLGVSDEYQLWYGDSNSAPTQVSVSWPTAGQFCIDAQTQGGVLRGRACRPGWNTEAWEFDCRQCQTSGGGTFATNCWVRSHHWGSCATYDAVSGDLKLQECEDGLATQVFYLFRD